METRPAPRRLSTLDETSEPSRRHHCSPGSHSVLSSQLHSHDHEHTSTDFSSSSIADGPPSSTLTAPSDATAPEWLPWATTLPRVSVHRKPKHSLPHSPALIPEPDYEPITHIPAGATFYNSALLAPQPTYRSHPANHYTPQSAFSDSEDAPDRAARRSHRRSRHGWKGQEPRQEPVRHGEGCGGTLLLNQDALAQLLEADSFAMHSNFVRPVTLGSHEQHHGSPRRSRPIKTTRPWPPPTPQSQRSPAPPLPTDMSLWDAKKFKNRHKRVQFKDH